VTTPSNKSIRGITGSTVNGVLLGPDVVLKKSVKGRDEIVTRAHKLALNLRRILIMVDGDQTIASIKELTTGLTDVEENLSLLIDLGFLEVSGLRVDETQTLQVIAAPTPQASVHPAVPVAPQIATPAVASAVKGTAAKPPLVPAMPVASPAKVKKGDAADVAKKMLPQNDGGPVSGFQEKLISARGEDAVGPSSAQSFAAKSSELIRIANENAIKNAVAQVVAADNSLTIPPSAHYKKLTDSGLAPISESRMAPERLNAAKAALIVEARRLLGADAERLIPRIQEVESVNDVMDWVLKFREYFLISGKDEADHFVSRFQEMLR
jgi:hypothetical protein